LPFWFLYHYLWWTLTIGSAWEAANNAFFSVYGIKFFFYVIFQAIGVYFNLYFLIPRFLEKRKYIEYVGLLILTIICNAVFIVSGYYASAWWAGRPLQELYYVKAPNYFLYLLKTNSLPSTAASMTLAMSIKLSKNWIVTKNREQVLEKEKLETELKFLKSQFNPHFLFNTINSIFVLIHKNPTMASEALAKFSDLLRYQLYDCNENYISLRQELTYLENFIELQRLRHDNNLVQIDVRINQQPIPDTIIAPFILIPFIENAFKHVSQQKGRKNWIRIHVRFDHDQLCFSIDNSLSNDIVSKNVVQYHGIGLKNVQRRLDLIYPDMHKLSIQKDDHHFEVILRVNLPPFRTEDSNSVMLKRYDSH
jgi:two-component system, LytTR family, sensor kinase